MTNVSNSYDKSSQFSDLILPKYSTTTISNCYGKWNQNFDLMVSIL